MRNTLPSSSAVGQALQTRREHRGLTRARVARASGVSVPELGAIESGRSQPSVAVLGRVARALGVSLVDLVRTSGPGRTDGVPSPATFSRLGLPEIARAVAEQPVGVGSKVDAAISAALLHSMKVCEDNQSAAARMLGMERKAFGRRLQRARRKAQRG
jgi:transcriptional regulator with XRE-family HTH domain